MEKQKEIITKIVRELNWGRYEDRSKKFKELLRIPWKFSSLKKLGILSEEDSLNFKLSKKTFDDYKNSHLGYLVPNINEIQLIPEVSSTEGMYYVAELTTSSKKVFYGVCKSSRIERVGERKFSSKECVVVSFYIKILCDVQENHISPK